MKVLVYYLVILGRFLEKCLLERWIIWRIWSWALRISIQLHTSNGHQHGGNLICRSLWRQLKTKVTNTKFLVVGVTVSSTRCQSSRQWQKPLRNYILHPLCTNKIELANFSLKSYENAFTGKHVKIVVFLFFSIARRCHMTFPAPYWILLAHAVFAFENKFFALKVQFCSWLFPRLGLG